jgi:hypothetical protein
VLQICPEAADDPPITTVMDANPNALRVRIVFDELLDPDVETLTDSSDGGPCTATSDTCDGHIATTMPVTLTCNNTPVPYDGYYVPNGNNISWPPGPALVVIPDGFVATSSACTVALRDNVIDKQGEVVPADQRGPFNFSVGPMVIDGSDPADGDEIVPDAPVVITFNVEVDPASVQAADIDVHDDTADVNVPVDITVTGTDIEILPTSGTWTDGSTYTVTIPDTATITDVGGGPYVPDGDFVITFTVAA